MPCRDWSQSEVVVRDDPEVRRRLDLATRVACTTLRSLRASEIKHLPEEVQRWWAAHQEEDRRREAREAAERERKALKKKALDKLTPAERKALNL